MEDPLPRGNTRREALEREKRAPGRMSREKEWREQDSLRAAAVKEPAGRGRDRDADGMTHATIVTRSTIAGPSYPSIFEKSATR